MLLPHFFTITLYIGLFTALKMRDTIKEIMKMLLDKIKEGFMRVNVTEYPKPLSWDMESFSMLNIPRRTLGMKENLKTILEMVRNNVSPSQRLTIEGSAIKNEAILKLVEYLKENGGITTDIGVKLTGKSVTQVRRYLKALSDIGMIEKIKMAEGI